MKKRLNIFFCLIATILLNHCLAECEDTILQTTTSPDGLLNAIVFTRNCGATTADSVHVCVVGKDEEEPASGNIFRGTHSREASIKWIGNDKLLIFTEAKTFLLMKEYAGITIELIPKPSNHKIKQE